MAKNLPRLRTDNHWQLLEYTKLLKSPVSPAPPSLPAACQCHLAGAGRIRPVDAQCKKQLISHTIH